MKPELLVVILSSGVVIKVLDILWECWKHRLDKKEEEEEKETEVECLVNILCRAVRAMIRSEILSLCETYNKRGCITAQQWDSLSCLYDNYKALNGNGFIDGEIDIVKHLPRA